MLYRITQCYLPTAAVTFPPLPQPKLVLDLATPEGCKAEFTWCWLYHKTVYLPETVTYLRHNWAVSWPETEPTTTTYESDILTTRPSGHEFWPTGQ